MIRKSSLSSGVHMDTASATTNLKKETKCQF